MAEKLRRRTKAREIAIQALYQLELLGSETLGDFRFFCKDAASGDRDIFDFCVRLVEGCWGKREKLDQEIEVVLEHWTMNRIALIDKCVLRMGAYELLFVPDVPPKVAINEAIDIAKKYSTEGSGEFVNGILDKIFSKHPRENEDPPVDDTGDEPQR